MSAPALFCSISSATLTDLIRSSKRLVCYVAPGVQPDVALALVHSCSQIGAEMLTVCVDFDERVMRMGYGDIEAVALLRTANINVSNVSGLRTALLIVDDEGWIFTPTALYLEADPVGSTAPNAVRMSVEQITEALARLSPSARAIAVAQAKTPEEKTRIESVPDEIRTQTLTDASFMHASDSLKEAPPVLFDVARQVRVFEPYLQYVELSLTGAAIQRHRLAIPSSIMQLGGGEDLENRLRTTFDLIERGSKLSSKPLEDMLNAIRKNFTPSLGKDHGRVVLKRAKPHLLARLQALRERLKKHQAGVEADLQKHLDTSREQIIAYYLPRVIETPPDALRGKLLSDEPSEQDAREWLHGELEVVFPSAKSLVQQMKLDERYKDVTFETLKRDDFLASVKAAFPRVDWVKPYADFRAVAEKQDTKRGNIPSMI